MKVVEQSNHSLYLIAVMLNLHIYMLYSRYRLGLFFICFTLAFCSSVTYSFYLCSRLTWTDSRWSIPSFCMYIDYRWPIGHGEPMYLTLTCLFRFAGKSEWHASVQSPWSKITWSCTGVKQMSQDTWVTQPGGLIAGSRNWIFTINTTIRVYK
jgi:hypothetical protein